MTPARKARRTLKGRLRDAASLDTAVTLVGYRYTSVALVLVAVLALYGAASLTRPQHEPEAAGATTEPITSAVLACPGREGTTLSVLDAPGGEKGHVDVVRTSDGEVFGGLRAPGGRWSREVDATPEGFIVWGHGAAAAGLSAEQTTHWDSGVDRGLAGARCARPGTDLWFLGPGPATAESIELHLTNVDARPASADVTALSGEGPLHTVEGRGIAVDPYSTRVVKLGESAEGLGDIVSGSGDLGLRVRATGGRVAASVRVRIAEGEGIEWLSPSPAPATSLTVPGVPGGDGRRRLLVAVPGKRDASVRVEVITPKGAFAPEGRDVLDVPAGTVVPLDLARALSGKPAAVRLVSDRPVLAGFTADTSADVAYGTATGPLTADRPGVVSANHFDSALILTAPHADATVRVTPVGPSGKGTPKDVQVPSSRTVVVELAAPPGAEGGYGALIEPREGSGPVHAARTITTGDEDVLLTALPVQPARTTVRLPDVGGSVTAVLP